jgi:tRNA threonylcarbamoyladenosine biosynthesis protein TsaB
METSGTAGSVAAADGPRLVAEHVLDPLQRSAQSLAPGIHRLLAAIGWRVRDIELVAVTVGPGSFTGLRVGVATAKVLAYAVGARCIGLNTLEVIAAQCRDDCSRLSVAMDAQRGQVFAGLFERSESGWRVIAAPGVLSNEVWLASLNPGIGASGPALLKLANHLPPGVKLIEPGVWRPRAAIVAALASMRQLAGAYDDVWKLAPLYLRKSAAEEKWEERGTGK